jgi:hypothetical protein
MKNLQIDYFSAARRVNPPRPGVYFWTLFYLELVKLQFKIDSPILSPIFYHKI